jgi:flagellar motor switch protein FliN/FliY
MAAVDLSDVYVDLAVELGRKEITLGEARATKPGDVIALDKLAGEAFDVLANGTQIAEAEVVVVTDLMAVRLTRMVEPKGGA